MWINRDAEDRAHAFAIANRDRCWTAQECADGAQISRSSAHTAIARLIAHGCVQRVVELPRKSSGRPMVYYSTRPHTSCVRGLTAKMVKKAKGKQDG